jgi:hypothetical protein
VERRHDDGTPPIPVGIRSWGFKALPQSGPLNATYPASPVRRPGLNPSLRRSDFTSVAASRDRFEPVCRACVADGQCHPGCQKPRLCGRPPKATLGMETAHSPGYRKAPANRGHQGLSLTIVRAIWELRQVEVYDRGPDGIVSTSGNSLFEVEGMFVP